MDCRALLSAIIDHHSQAKKFHKNGIKDITATPYRPSSNGAVERAAQTLKSTMHKIVVESSNIPVITLISRFLFSYCNTPYTHTGRAPSELLFNLKGNTRLSLSKLNRSIVNDEIFVKSKISKSLIIFYPGDQVWLHNY